MKSEIIQSKDYLELLQEVKSKVRNAQIKAAMRVNSELILLYWDLGEVIVRMQEQTKWGDSFIKQLSKDLLDEFHDLKGFSERNLQHIRRFFLFYSDQSMITKQLVSENQPIVIAKQLVSQIIKQPIGKIEKKKSKKKKQQDVADLNYELKTLLSLVPWGHHIQIIRNSKDIESAFFYVAKTIENNWSRSVLVHQIEIKLFERQGKIISNFELTLPKSQSDLALQTLKDPYIFDFLTMKDKADEKDIEEQLTSHITKFLLELGTGFAYLGRQYHMEVSGKDYYLDLLFYHLKLRCYIIIELKAVDFKPEFAGKLNFYLSVVDDLLKSENDNSSIGLILCKSKDKITAEYALRGMSQPIGVAEYQLVKAIPDNLKSSLPSIEELEMELMKKE